MHTITTDIYCTTGREEYELEFGTAGDALAIVIRAKYFSPIRQNRYLEVAGQGPNDSQVWRQYEWVPYNITRRY